jgi:hypothetical protein
MASPAEASQRVAGKACRAYPAEVGMTSVVVAKEDVRADLLVADRRSSLEVACQVDLLRCPSAEYTTRWNER